MRCINIYFYSKTAEANSIGRHDPLAICGGFCKRHFPTGMWCWHKDYKHLCPGKGHEDPAVIAPPEPIIEKPVVIEPIVEKPVVVPQPVVEFAHKHKRGRPVGRK